jgi:hypothetical protein
MRTKKLTYENKKPTSENQTDKKTKTSESKKNIRIVAVGFLIVFD